MLLLLAIAVAIAVRVAAASAVTNAVPFDGALVFDVVLIGAIPAVVAVDCVSFFLVESHCSPFCRCCHCLYLLSALLLLLLMLLWSLLRFKSDRGCG